MPKVAVEAEVRALLTFRGTAWFKEYAAEFIERSFASDQAKVDALRFASRLLDEVVDEVDADVDDSEREPYRPYEPWTRLLGPPSTWVPGNEDYCPTEAEIAKARDHLEDQKRRVREPDSLNPPMSAVELARFDAECDKWIADLEAQRRRCLT